MKSWQVSDEIKKDPALAALVERSRHLLEEIVGPFSKDLVDAQWTLDRVAGKPLLKLTLSDWTWRQGKCITIDPVEMTDQSAVYSRFVRVWGDLLQARNHEQLRELMQSTVE